MENALNYFKNIQDPRSNRNQKHPVMTLIGTTLLASLAGIDSFSGFAESHFEELEKYVEFPHGPPSHDTYQRFWDGINPQELYCSFETFTQALVTAASFFVGLLPSFLSSFVTKITLQECLIN
jgi:hypothetical protein